MSRQVCAALVALVLVGAACSPDSEVTSVSELDTVITAHAPNADFPGARTFALVDSVYHLVEEGAEDDLTREYDDVILGRVRANMLAYGWTEITAPDSTSRPDVAVQVGVTTSDNLAISYWPPYWGWYPGWGYPGYGWGWGGYYTAYSYTTGTVLTAMLDLKHPDTVTEAIPVMWLAAVNGVASGEQSNQTRIVNGIDQAFKQSPYLTK